MSRMFNLMRDRLSRLSRRARWTVAIFASAIVVAVLLSFFIDEPLRRSVEGQMNDRLPPSLIWASRPMSPSTGSSSTTSSRSRAATTWR